MQPNIQPPKKQQKEINQEIFTYTAPWMIFAAAFSYVQDNPYRLALGSFLDHSNNKVQIVQLNDDSTYLKKVAEFNHPFPPTKLMWYPDRYEFFLRSSASIFKFIVSLSYLSKTFRLGYNKGQDLIASTGDFLRLWELNGTGGANLKALLNNVRTNFLLPIANRYPFLNSRTCLMTNAGLWLEYKLPIFLLLPY